MRHLAPDVKRGVKAGLRQICTDPETGKLLRDEFEGFRTYRIGRFRIIYSVDETRKVIRLAAVGHRRTIYEELSELLRRGPGVEEPRRRRPRRLLVNA